MWCSVCVRVRVGGHVRGDACVRVRVGGQVRGGACEGEGGRASEGGACVRVRVGGCCGMECAS